MLTHLNVSTPLTLITQIFSYKIKDTRNRHILFHWYVSVYIKICKSRSNSETDGKSSKERKISTNFPYERYPASTPQPMMKCWLRYGSFPLNIILYIRLPQPSLNPYFYKLALNILLEIQLFERSACLGKHVQIWASRYTARH